MRDFFIRGFETILSVVLVLLAIGIGANTAIFSVVNTLLIQRLPYGEPERLMVVWEHNLPRDRKANVVSPGNYIHWREMNQVFEDIAAVAGFLCSEQAGFVSGQVIYVAGGPKA